tara:strand:+ start:53 stop:223 length:171 start_codon:yes stop_codon:yes gene_type:complete
MFYFRKQKRTFVKKNMKKILIIFSFFAVLAILSSCGLYKEPCEGVGSVNVVTDKNI